ncbi:hypothetical protein DFJ74DRAFT_679831 [Hyaloraphidium curvatum]|nr:hypothetical protein DFJ74DRAFT_679831 [Hyaloraphidium curvatum]
MLTANFRRLPRYGPEQLPRPAAVSDPATAAELGAEAEHVAKAVAANMATGTEQHEELGLVMATLNVHEQEVAQGQGFVPPSVRRIEQVGQDLGGQLESLAARVDTSSGHASAHFTGLESTVMSRFTNLEALMTTVTDSVRTLGGMFAYEMNSHDRAGTATRLLKEIANADGKRPTDEGLPPLELFEDIVALDDEELDHYLRFYKRPNIVAGYPPLAPADLRREKLAALGEKLGLSNAAIERLRDSV